MGWPKGRLQTQAEKDARAATRQGFHTMPRERMLAIRAAGCKVAVWMRRRRTRSPGW